MRRCLSIYGLIAAASGAGCFDPQSAPSLDASVQAPGTDAPPDACISFSTQLDTCPLTLVADVAPTATALSFDTNTLLLTTNDGASIAAPAAVLATHGAEVGALLVHDFQLAENAMLRATGTRPFAIVASGRIVIATSAAVDVSTGGAGALGECTTPARKGEDRPTGASGGGGGGYGAIGGNGGSGDLDDGPVTGGNGAVPIPLPAGPYGGCGGATGGRGIRNALGGAGGLGGGAVYLVAAERIQLGDMAVVTAGGGGGKGGGVDGGQGDAGGGGGGSGGMVLLEALNISGITARISANGGAGGGGSSDLPGNDGEDASRTTVRAAGGAGGLAQGSDGGRGGSAESTSGETVLGVEVSGGGGGGGGVGYIRILSAQPPQLGDVSPAPTN